MRIKKHTSNFINSDYGSPDDIELVKEQRFVNKLAFIYRVLNDNIKMHQESNRYMGSFYYVNKWYSIIKYFKDNQNALGYYININKPPKMENGIVMIEDLFLDIWVNPDYSYRILDMDELDSAKQQGAITDSIYHQVLNTMEELIFLITEKKLPDDFVIKYTIEP